MKTWNEMNKVMFKIMFRISVEQIENNEGFTFIILLWGLNSMKFPYVNCSKDLIWTKYKIFYASLSCCNLKVFVFLGAVWNLKNNIFLNVWLVGLFVGICLAMQCCFHFYSHIFCLDVCDVLKKNLVILVIHIEREFISWPSTLIYNWKVIFNDN